MTSLNPVLTVGRQIGEVLQVHEGLRRRQARERAVELLDARRHPLRRAAGRQLPPPALRRHAPAGHDRDGGGLPAEGAGRRRADHRAGRHRAGRHPRRAAGPARPARHQHPGHHPRPRRHRRRRRPGGGHVRRPRGRAGRCRRAVRPPAAPLHRRAAVGLAGARPARRHATGCRRSPAWCRSCATQPDACTFADRCPAADAQCLSRRRRPGPLPRTGRRRQVPRPPRGLLAPGRCAGPTSADRRTEAQESIR